MHRPYHHGALREALLLAAETILERDGLAALTLRAVAREAGVSHGAPAHHFRDFADLLSALAASGFRRLQSRMAAEKGRGAKLRQVGRAYVDFARTHPNLFLLMFRSDQRDTAHPGLAEAREAAFTLLSGDNPSPSSLVTATSRWALVHGLALLMIDGRLGSVGVRAGLDEDELLDAVLAVTKAG